MAIKKEIYAEEEESEKNPKRKTSRNLVIALSIVSIIGFVNIILESLFYINISEYIDTFLLIVLGLGLIFETSIGELKSINKEGLNSEYIGKITMIVVGSLSVIAGVLSLPQINILNPSFLAVKGIISLLAIVFIILQTWVAKHEE
jgi:hypothetical protein